MTHDKELLELAAKGAGLTVRWHSNGYYGPTMEIMEDESGGSPWNPLTDDGDALRLAVKLGIDIQHHFKHVETWKVGLNEIIEFHDDDPYAATRRAIVRAAAEIGKAM